MIHDQGLVDQLSSLATERFEGEVFRATGAGADALAFSGNGGRWAPAARDGVDVPVLYTSRERDGALAEVVSWLIQLTPLPLSRPLKVTRLGVSTAKTLHLARVSLERLGVDMACYGERDYERTQSIGAALAFLGLDGLVAPSARWNCENLMIYQNNHMLTERLESLAPNRSSGASGRGVTACLVARRLQISLAAYRVGMARFQLTWDLGVAAALRPCLNDLLRHSRSLQQPVLRGGWSPITNG